MSQEQEEKNAASTFESIAQIVKMKRMVRNAKHRFDEKFGITRLAPERMEDGLAFLVGNEPELPVVAKEEKSSERFALVGTSCLRSLEVAAMFCAEETDFIPKIYLVDNSAQVIKVWKQIKFLFAQSENMQELENEIKKELLEFCVSQKYQMAIEQFQGKYSEKETMEIARDAAKVEIYRAQKLVSRIIGSNFGNGSEAAGFLRLKRMVSAVEVVAHDWTIAEPFKKIKARSDAHGLKTYVYGSNIMACLNKKEALVRRMKENIRLLEPVASLHADRDPIKHKPTQYKLYRGDGLDNIDRDLLGLIDSKEMYRRFSNLSLQKRHQEALPYAEKLVDIAYAAYMDERSQDNGLSYSAILYNVSLVYTELGRFRGAELVLKEALNIRKTLFDPESVRMITEKLAYVQKKLVQLSPSSEAELCGAQGIFSSSSAAAVAVVPSPIPKHFP